uniref:PDZ domain-containing protein n=1 Tax=Parastrongyloides trichosuri TaxID=131310 RepID=A0A0N4Z6Q2_PARTI
MYFCIVQSVEDKNVGIYVKKVFEGGAAHRDGRIDVGDQLLSLNGHSLVGISQEAAADIMTKCGQQVNFEVAKNAAYYNGLSSWFAKHSDDKDHKYQQRMTNNQTPSYNGSQYGSHVNVNHHGPVYRQRTTSESSMQSNLHNNPSKQTHQLPSHYRTTHRPAVIQPGRPNNYTNSIVSSSSIGYSGGSNDYNSMKQIINRGPGTSGTRVRSSSVIPFGQENKNMLPPHIPSLQQPLSSTSNFSNNPLHQRDSHLNGGRRSAPIFAEAMTPEKIREKLNDELDILDSKGDKMTDSDRMRYREIVHQLGNISTSPQKNGFNLNVSGNRQRQHHVAPPPFLSEMTSKFEQKRQSQSSTLSGSSSSNHHKNGVESLIDTVVADVKKINLTVEENLINQLHVNSSLNVSNSSSNDKQVEQMSPNSQEENKNPLQDQIIERDSNDLKIREQEEDDVDEPRVQIIGNNEIYNDPRIRRLNEIQSRSNRTNIDGSNLDFRDKMKMFAASLGEETPKTKVSISSAQREIESNLEKK